MPAAEAWTPPCAIQTATPTANGTSTATGIDNLEIARLETICTFNDSLAKGTLKVIKSVVNDNGGTLAAGAFTVHVKSGGNDVAAAPPRASPAPAAATTRWRPAPTW